MDRTYCSEGVLFARAICTRLRVRGLGLRVKGVRVLGFAHRVVGEADAVVESGHLPRPQRNSREESLPRVDNGGLFH
eukprot:4653113-Pyramimonas_sp.AAC.1